MSPSASDTGWAARLGRFAESAPAQRTITALIIANAVSLGLETVPWVVERAGLWLYAFDRLVLAVFVAEIAAKLAWRRFGFFRNGWNVFDFVIVGFALLPAAGPLAVLRALRILRVLRLLSVVPQMRRVVGALLQAVPGLLSVGAIILLFFYVGAVLATKLFGATFPDWFGSIGASMYTLFQVMTLESWSMGIVRPVMDVYPLAWMFFVPFIVVTSFAILNLFIGIIVDATQTVHQQEDEAAAARSGELHPAEAALVELRALRAEVAELKDLLGQGRN
ncbi:ion transporter [Roseospirillum parvum]|uniref:Voltage-gated sodium channel n=1 Tax=Roseospirillum parvum TaxID=83401 RepID=A0A1G7XPS4_9PROT|nr:ion transporter [Roseospirillum parvum]SDG86219.1 voltage-gated sodium channel [Roseospirillum parvum]